MPRIRKKTSNRSTTRDRAKITKKVSEHTRKTKRNAKKDPTWKSKKKADPGVPNSFHLKDQVLAELAEEKRKNEEAKIARREASKREAQEAEEEDTPGIASITSSSVLRASAPIASSSKQVGGDDEEDDSDIPELVDTELATLQDVLEKADVVLQVVDARDIQGGRSGHVEGLINEAGGKYGLIVNKIDLAPRETLQAWLPHLPTNTFLFSAQPQPSTSASAGSSSLGRSELLKAFKSWSKDGEVTIALMGLPSVGKTAVLNSLLPASAASRYTVAPPIPTAAAAKNPQPTTKKPVEVILNLEDVKVRVIDTPGWEHVEEDEEEEDEDEDEGEDGEEKNWDELEERLAGDILRRNLGRIDRLKDISPLANYIFKRSNAQDLMLAYNVPFFQPGELEAFLLAVARANGRVKKHGDADLDAAARIVVRDWASGLFPFYTPAPAATEQTTSAGDRPDMSKVLEAVRTRKEMRATGRGLIKFKGGEIDQREVILDDDYIALAQGDSDDEDEDEFTTDEAALLGLAEEEDDEDDEDEDEEDVEEEEEDEEEEEGLVIAEEDGEELDLEDGPEPSSGSDVPDDAEEDDESSEEQEEVEPAPQPVQKRKRKSDVSIIAPTKKAKRVSFGKNEVRTIAGKVGGKRKR